MLDAMAGMMPGDPYAARPHLTRQLRPEGYARRPKKLRARSSSTRARSGQWTRKRSPRSSTAAATFREMGHSIEAVRRSIRARCYVKFARVIVSASVSAAEYFRSGTARTGGARNLRVGRENFGGGLYPRSHRNAQHRRAKSFTR